MIRGLDHAGVENSLPSCKRVSALAAAELCSVANAGKALPSTQHRLPGADGPGAVPVT